MHGAKPFRLNLNLSTIQHFYNKSALKEANPHVHFSSKGVHSLDPMKIQLLAVDGHINGNPIGRVKHLGKIFWIAIFPPANARLIRVIHTR